MAHRSLNKCLSIRLHRNLHIDVTASPVNYDLVQVRNIVLVHFVSLRPLTVLSDT